MCNDLISCLMERGFCTKAIEFGDVTISLHKLVKQAIKLFHINEDERLEWIKYTFLYILLFDALHNNAINMLPFLLTTLSFVVLI